MGGGSFLLGKPGNLVKPPGLSSVLHWQAMAGSHEGEDVRSEAHQVRRLSISNVLRQARCTPHRFCQSTFWGLPCLSVLM
eukprot:3800447-Amphidinium_carterae.1